MLKIYDCSNSQERPVHRKKSLCPLENDIVRDLKKYANNFGFRFVKIPSDADLLFTNDVFSRKLLLSNSPKVKRMDGIFSLKSLRERNEKLNVSAQASDCVIFISNFAKKSYYKLYGNKLKKSKIIVNNVNDKIFKPSKLKRNKELIFSSSASNWSRPEKRFKELKKLGKSMKEIIYLIGKCNYKIPKNIIKLGYIKDYKKINNILNLTDGFINLSYKDTAPKVVCQAVSCGLPILYANSGGVKELIGKGVKIKDNNKISFENNIPKLNPEEVKRKYLLFKSNINNLKKKSLIFKRPYQLTLKEYFDTFKEIIDKNRKKVSP